MRMNTLLFLLLLLWVGTADAAAIRGQAPSSSIRRRRRQLMINRWPTKNPILPPTTTPTESPTIERAVEGQEDDDRDRDDDDDRDQDDRDDDGEEVNRDRDDDDDDDDEEGNEGEDGDDVGFEDGEDDNDDGEDNVEEEVEDGNNNEEDERPDEGPEERPDERPEERPDERPDDKPDDDDDDKPPPKPPVSEPTKPPAPAPTQGVEFRIPLLEFAMEYVGDEQDTRAATEAYLMQSMNLQHLSGVELIPRRRRLQEASQVTVYSGESIFDNLPVPTLEQVHSAQVTALQDAPAMEAAFAESNVVVQDVKMMDSDPLPASTENNVALIAGVAAAAVVVVLAAFVFAYRKYRRAKNDILEKDKHDDDIDEEIPNYNKEEASKQDNNNRVLSPFSTGTPLGDQSTMDQSTDLDMDEYSLSAQSADSSKKDPEKRRESLLKKLALYQKSEKPPERIMPASFFAPQVVRDQSDLSVDSVEMIAASSLTAIVPSILSSPRDSDSETSSQATGQEVDLLPPPDMSSSLVAVDTSMRSEPGSIHARVRDVSSIANVTQSSIRSQPGSTRVRSYSPEISHEMIAQEVSQEVSHASWKRDLEITTIDVAASDVPSDELNFQKEQDLSDFYIAPIVEPTKQTADTMSSSTAVVVSPELPPPPGERRSERRSRTLSAKGRRQPDDDGSYDGSYNGRNRASSLRRRQDGDDGSYSGSYIRRNRTSSSKSRRRRTHDDEGSFAESYKSGYSSNGEEVLEDLNSLSDFLKERREAKRAQRRSTSRPSRS